MKINEPISPTEAQVHTSAVSLNHEAITSQLRIDSSDSQESREHAWLDTDYCFTQMTIFTVISKEARPPHALCAHTQNTHHVTSHSFLATSFWDNCFSFFSPAPSPLPTTVWIRHSCWSPDWVKFKNKNIFLHWICNIQTSASFSELI